MPVEFPANVPKLELGREDIANLLLASVALEEMSLASILRFGEEKLKVFLDEAGTDAQELCRSLERSIYSISQMQMMLSFKVETFKKLAALLDGFAELSADVEKAVAAAEEAPKEVQKEVAEEIPKEAPEEAPEEGDVKEEAETPKEEDVIEEAPAEEPVFETEQPEPVPEAQPAAFAAAVAGEEPEALQEDEIDEEELEEEPEEEPGEELEEELEEDPEDELEDELEEEPEEDLEEEPEDEGEDEEDEEDEDDEEDDEEDGDDEEPAEPLPWEEEPEEAGEEEAPEAGEPAMPEAIELTEPEDESELEPEPEPEPEPVRLRSGKLTGTGEGYMFDQGDSSRRGVASIKANLSLTGEPSSNSGLKYTARFPSERDMGPLTLLTLPQSVSVELLSAPVESPSPDRPNEFIIRGQGISGRYGNVEELLRNPADFVLTVMDYGKYKRFRMEIASANPSLCHDSGLVQVLVGNLQISWKI